MRWVGRPVILTLLAFYAAAAPASAERVSAPAHIFLLQYVRDGGVDYARLAKEADALAKGRQELAKKGLLLATEPEPLPASVEELAGTSRERLAEGSKPNRIAFWINAYNILTIDLIVHEWRVRKGRLKSIKDIPAAWSGPKWTVAGRTLTLDQIEHDVLRREFHEPRIHFALVCASKSCPALRSAEFQGELLDAQLDSAARDFVLDPTRNDFTPRDGAIRISQIFDWYGKDFVGVYSDSTFERLYGRETGAVLAYVTRFLPAETVAALRTKRVRVTYLPYDWSLNYADPR